MVMTTVDGSWLAWSVGLSFHSGYKQHEPQSRVEFNGLTANGRWHRIYRSQQRSLLLGKHVKLQLTIAG